MNYHSKSVWSSVSKSATKQVVKLKRATRKKITKIEKRRKKDEREKNNFVCIKKRNQIPSQRCRHALRIFYAKNKERKRSRRETEYGKEREKRAQTATTSKKITRNMYTILATSNYAISTLIISCSEFFSVSAVRLTLSSKKKVMCSLVWLASWLMFLVWHSYLRLKL